MAYAPSYNVQIDTDAKNGVVVAVGVVQAGNDFEQLEPGVDRVQHNLKETPKEVVTDGGYVSKDTIVAMKERAIEYIAPCVDEAGKGQSSYDNRGVSAEYHSSSLSTMPRVIVTFVRRERYFRTKAKNSATCKSAIAIAPSDRTVRDVR